MKNSCHGLLVDYYYSQLEIGKKNESRWKHKSFDVEINRSNRGPGSANIEKFIDGRSIFFQFFAIFFLDSRVKIEYTWIECSLVNPKYPRYP